MAERPGVLRIGDRVVFAGAEHSVVALSGSLVRLMADSGEVTAVAMAYLAGAPDFAMVASRPRARVSSAGLLESLPAEVAREWERHPRWRPGYCRARLPVRARGRNTTRWPVPCSSGRGPRRRNEARACARFSGCGTATGSKGYGGWSIRAGRMDAAETGSVIEAVLEVTIARRQVVTGARPRPGPMAVQKHTRPGWGDAGNGSRTAWISP